MNSHSLTARCRPCARRCGSTRHARSSPCCGGAEDVLGVCCSGCGAWRVMIACSLLQPSCHAPSRPSPFASSLQLLLSALHGNVHRDSFVCRELLGSYARVLRSARVSAPVTPRCCSVVSCNVVLSAQACVLTCYCDVGTRGNRQWWRPKQRVRSRKRF